MKIAFLFPGQGVGIERAVEIWCERSNRVRQLIEMAAHHAALAADGVSSSCRAQGLEKLSAAVDSRARPGRFAGGTMPTELLEPVLTALCLGIHHELLERGLVPGVVAGHSLGEIAAASAAGSCPAEEAVALAAERGRLMAREAARRPGGMLSINAPTGEEAEAAVAFAKNHGIVALAAHNGPEQWVVAGEWAALRRIASRYPTLSLPVAGAWHTAVLAGAVEEFRAAARRALSMPLSIPFVSNRTGSVVERTEEIPDLLAEQLTHPVLWAQTMQTLALLGVTDLVTIGPGRVLRGLVWFNLGESGVLHGTETPEELERTVEALAP